MTASPDTVVGIYRRSPNGSASLWLDADDERPLGKGPSGDEVVDGDDAGQSVA